MMKPLLLVMLFIPSIALASSDTITHPMKTLKVGYPAFDWAPFTYVSKEGRVSGLLPSLMDEIAQRSGYRIESVTYPTFQDVLDAFNSSEIDLLAGVSSTFGRQKHMYFSAPLLVTPMAVLSKNAAIRSFKQIEDQVIAVERGFAISEQLQLLSATQPKTISFPCSFQAVNAVRLNTADAYIGNAITLDNMHSRSEADNKLFIHELPDLPYERLYIAGHMEQADIINDLNKGYHSLRQHQLTEIYDTWLTKSQQQLISAKDFLTLNDEEKKWLDGRNTLTIAYHPDDSPYQFTDAKGNLAGMSADVAKLLAKQLKLRLVPTPQTSFEATLSMLDNGEIDIVAAVTCTPERSKAMACTHPFTEEQWIAVTSITSDKRSIIPGAVIGAVSNRYGQVIGQQLYRSNSFLLYENNAQLLDAVIRGTIDAAVISLSSASALLHTEYLGRLQAIPSKLDQHRLPVGLIVSRDNLLLRDILNKALNAVSPQKLSNIENKWSNVTLNAGVSYPKLILWGMVITGGSIVIFSCFFYWNRKLSSEINQRKAAEQKLTYLTNNFDGVLLQHIQHSDDPMDIQLLFVSDKIEDLTCLTVSELYAQPLRLINLLKNRHDRDQLFHALQEAVKNGVWKTELQLLSCGKGERWIEVRSQIIPLEQGWQWTSILIDISQMKQQQFELEHARQQAEAATETKSRFLAMMSHEIRTPISGILSLLELLTPYTLHNGKAEGIHKNLTQSAHNLLNIVNDVLDFSKIEAGKLALQAENCQLAELINTLVQPHVIHAGQKGLRFSLWVDPMLANQLAIDELRLKQVLNNLLNNATKFTIHGEISLYLDVINQSEDRQTLRFMVKDTGVGISQHDITKLFLPFEQADLSSERRFSGTGLGLSICRQLVQLMGGEITVNSELGQGSTFSFQFEAPVIEAATTYNMQRRCGLFAPDLSEHIALRRYLNYWHNQTVSINATEQAELIAVCQAQQLDLLIITEEKVNQLRLTAEWARQHLPEIQWLIVREQSMLSPEPEALGWKISAFPLISDHLLHILMTPAIPVVPEIYQPVPTRTATTREQAVARNQLILVAEDHPINQQIIYQQLQQIGYYADIVGNGQLALQALQQHPYQLVLTDCHMPVLDGYGLVRAIRQRSSLEGRQYGQQHSLSYLPVIALTANTSSCAQESCGKYGFDGFLVKPVSLQQLQATLQQWLPAQPDRDSAPESVPDPVRREPEIQSVINLSQLETIFGDASVCIDLLHQYLESCLCDFTELSDAVTRNDADRTRLISHRMKGAARMMEFNAMAESCESIEQQATKGHIAVNSKELDKINSLIAILKKQVEQLQ